MPRRWLTYKSIGFLWLGLLSCCSLSQPPSPYTFVASSEGARVPVIHCLPLHACAIRFKPKEAILSFTVGDPTGWKIWQEETGTMDTPLSILFLIPSKKAQPTNILVTTAANVYNFDIVPGR